MYEYTNMTTKVTIAIKTAGLLSPHMRSFVEVIKDSSLILKEFVVCMRIIIPI